MPGVAGRKALVKVAGAAVAFVTEACTNSGDSKTYQITNAIKRVWDPTIAITVFYNAVLQAANTYTINRLTGKITFAVAQGASAVTVTGSYLPLSNAVRAKSFSWNVTASRSSMTMTSIRSRRISASSASSRCCSMSAAQSLRSSALTSISATRS
jgi:hypothetical protein